MWLTEGFEHVLCLKRVVDILQTVAFINVRDEHVGKGQRVPDSCCWLRACVSLNEGPKKLGKKWQNTDFHIYLFIYLVWLLLTKGHNLEESTLGKLFSKWSNRILETRSC